MRITYDRQADAVYVYLTDEPLTPGRTTIQTDTPPDVQGFVVLDWKGNRLVGLEVLDASERLHPDLLAEAEIIG